MDLCIKKENEALIVKINGDIDHHTILGAREKIDEELTNGKQSELVFDLSETVFMDSSGLGLILGRYKKAKDIGIGFKLRHPNESILKILNLAGADRIFEIERRK